MADVALTPITDRHPTRTLWLGLSGIASGVLLVAALIWAHHWGVRADAIVAGWAVTTAVGFIGGFRYAPGWLLMGRIAKFGIVFSMISVIALIIATIAWAAGQNPAGACGGG